MLKKKADALKKAFNDVCKAIVATKKRMGKEYNECLLDMAQATFAAGDFGVTVRDSVKVKPSVQLMITSVNVAGVHKPTFLVKGMNEKGDDDQVLGLTGGGQAIMKAKTSFTKYFKVLMDIASYQTQYVTIERALQVTNRRVNALEFVVIPKIENIIKWIDGELDELNREEFFRLKIVQDKKEIAKLEEEEEIEARQHKSKEQNVKSDAEKNATEDIFEQFNIGGDEEDEDVIF